MPTLPLPPDALVELRRLAARIIRHERPGHTLQATSLFHEAFLRLAPRWRSFPSRDVERRALFATTMRRVLIDHARRRRVRRDAEVASTERRKSAQEIAATGELRDAMIDLAEADPRGAAITAMRFFDGLSTDEIARLLGLCQRTVGRDWSAARAWLTRVIKEVESDAD